MQKWQEGKLARVIHLDTVTTHHTHAYTIKDCEHLHEYEYQYQEGKAGKGTVGT